MEFRYHHNGTDYTVSLEPQGGNTYLAHIEDRAYTVEAIPDSQGGMTLVIDGQRIRAYTATNTTRGGESRIFTALADGSARVYELQRAQNSGARRAAGGAGNGLEAQMPGVITQVLVEQGASVEEGQSLLIMEAMKMEIRVTAPYAGTLTELLVNPGDQVDRGQTLARVEAS